MHLNTKLIIERHQWPQGKLEGMVITLNEKGQS